MPVEDNLHQQTVLIDRSCDGNSESNAVTREAEKFVARLCTEEAQYPVKGMPAYGILEAALAAKL